MIGLILACWLAQDPDWEGIFKKLDSDEAKVRQEGQEELEAAVKGLGDRADEALTMHLRHPSAEVRTRIKNVLDHREAVRRCRASLSAFELLGLPSCRGKKFAEFNSGAWAIYDQSKLSFRNRWGWVLHETPDNVTLLETNLCVNTYPRKVELPKQVEELKAALGKGVLEPGEIRVVDFPSFCRRLLETGPKDNFGDFEHFSRGGLAHEIEPALYAFWALQIDEAQVALSLVESSNRALKKDEENPISFEERLAGALRSNLRWQAIMAAHEGEARASLVKRWKTIDKLATDDAKKESEEMIARYEAMVKEDGEWKEPAQATVEAWIYRLRDLNARQMGQPGDCYVLGPWSGVPEDAVNPADELYKIGWDAIPLIIEHLDDARTTRCLRYWRNFAPDSYYLLRVGDCCHQIFQAITGVEIYRIPSTSGSLMRDGQSQTAKERAQQWWKENREGGAEGFFLKSLESDRAGFAAAKLLELDAKKHLPRLLEAARRGAADRKAGVFLVLSDRLGPEHRELIESFVESEHWEVSAVAARLLWRHVKSDAGALKLIGRVEGSAGNDRTSWHYDHAMEVLSGIRTDAVVEGYARLLRSQSKAIRKSAIDRASHMPERKIADGLVEILSDTDPTGWSSYYPIRFCDAAAEALARMVRPNETLNLEKDESKRDGQIAELKAWYVKSREALDWPALVKAAEERRER